MSDVSRHQIAGLRGGCTFKKDVVVRVRTGANGFHRPDPKTFVMDGVERRGDNGLRAPEPGSPDHFFVLGINIAADAQ